MTKKIDRQVQVKNHLGRGHQNQIVQNKDFKSLQRMLTSKRKMNQRKHCKGNTLVDRQKHCKHLALSNIDKINKISKNQKHLILIQLTECNPSYNQANNNTLWIVPRVVIDDRSNPIQSKKPTKRDLNRLMDNRNHGQKVGMKMINKISLERAQHDKQKPCLSVKQLKTHKTTILINNRYLKAN